MNVKSTHIVQFILTMTIISAAAVSNYYPAYATLAMLVGAIAAGANLNLALLSSSIVDPTPQQKAASDMATATKALSDTIQGKTTDVTKS